MCRLGDEQEESCYDTVAFSGCRYQNNPQKTRPFNIQQGKKLVAGMDVNMMMRLATTNNGFSTKG
ncbi:hypothetical protein ACNKHU_19320 [Shigella flexneri]